MRYLFFRIVLVIILFLVWIPSSWISSYAHIQSQRIALSATNMSVHRTTTDPTSVTILDLDMSGSMQTNDPNGYRCSAANAFIDLSGPGNFIGIVGLNNDGDSRGGPHNFQLAQEWSQPREMQTQSDRQALQGIIASKSDGCKPHNSTPTYDSLNRSLKMLATAPHGPHTRSSVILLTDGVPDPDTQEQMAAIKSDLLPQFKRSSWAIDTVALGNDAIIEGAHTTFHKFLSELSNATGGQFYDTVNVVVPELSPLNIAPFFVDIFSRYNNRSLSKDVPATPVDDLTKRNFTVTDYTNSLDVIVVKDTTSTAVSLKVGNRVITHTEGNVRVSTDPYYTIFSIEHPEPGQWEVDVNGTGKFLLDSLKISGLGVSIEKITQENLGISIGSHLARNYPITVTAFLTNNGNPSTDQHYTLRGTIAYKGANGYFTHDFILDDRDASGTHTGTYKGSVTVPSTAPVGSYEIVIKASEFSLDNIIASQSQTVTVEVFPVPSFISPLTRQTTDKAVESTVTQWDSILHWFYTQQMGWIQWLRPFALQNLPAEAYADFPGQVELEGKLYSNAKVSAIAISAKLNTQTPVKVINDGKGHFHAAFPPLSEGDYNVTFTTSGTFEDSYGDFGRIVRPVHLIVNPATTRQEVVAWAITILFFLLCLGFTILTILIAGHFILKIGGYFLQGGKKPPGPPQRIKGTIAGTTNHKANSNSIAGTKNLSTGRASTSRSSTVKGKGSSITGRRQ